MVNFRFVLHVNERQEERSGTAAGMLKSITPIIHNRPIYFLHRECQRQAWKFHKRECGKNIGMLERSWYGFI